MPPKPERMKEYSLPAHLAKYVKDEFNLRRTLSASTPPATPVVRRPTLWAASPWWDCYSLTPCPLYVQAYDSGSTTFANSHNSIKLLKNGDQFLMMATVSMCLYDEGINPETDYTRLPTMWGGLQGGSMYVESTMMTGRLIAIAHSSMENITHSNPPQRILTFTKYFEAWQDNEELKLYASSGYGHPRERPVKLWAKLVELQIVKL